jgi:O-antigen/teichoic acid export membrane protein
MASIRRALVFASVGRYASRAINLGTTVVIARMMDPKEFGVSVLGASSFLILGAIRELASVNYLVQQTELTRDKINSAFTISFAITVLLTAVVLLLADPIAALYGEPRLASYIQIVTIGFALGPFMQPIYALWSRELAFRTISAMDVLAAGVNAVASIVLVGLGFSYIGLAWSSTISTLIGVGLALWLSRSQLAIFRFSLKEWRSVLSFGLYGSATSIIYRVSDALAFLVLGRLLNTYAIGLLQRAIMLATFTETVILAGVNSITLPAFSHKARSGADLKQAYLTAISYVTAVQWPALAFISAMATPLTLLLLGPRWMEIAPLAQIIALSLMFNFAATLNFPILVAVGAIRKTWPTAVAQVIISQIVIVWAASQGLMAIALSGLVTVPVGLVLWTALVRAHVSFSLYELLTSLRKSFVVLLCSAAGPVAVLIYRSGVPSILDAAVAAILCAAGWLLAIRMTRHPFLYELAKVRNFIWRKRPQKEGA